MGVSFALIKQLVDVIYPPNGEDPRKQALLLLMSGALVMGYTAADFEHRLSAVEKHVESHRTLKSDYQALLIESKAQRAKDAVKPAE